MDTSYDFRIYFTCFGAASRWRECSTAAAPKGIEM